MDEKLHWTRHWETIATQVAQRPRLLVASNFEGTLSATARAAGGAGLPAGTRTLLRRLAGCDGVQLAFVAESSLVNVNVDTDVERVFYVGDRGQNARADLDEAIAFLRERITELKGVSVDDDRTTVTVHWRFASEASRETLRNLMKEIEERHPRLRIVAGEFFSEVRRCEGWNRGDTLTQLTALLGLTSTDVLYLGEDLADEDAFNAVHSQLTFLVGEDSVKSAAKYRLRDAADAQAFLFCVLGARSQRNATKREDHRNNRVVLRQPLTSSNR